MGQAVKPVLLILVTLVTLNYVRAKRATGKNHYGNPCHDIYENTTIPTSQGNILCAVPTEEELTEQLKGLGGYNKHYVARTQKEVKENFENLLPWDGEETTKPQYHYGRHPTFRSKLRSWKSKSKSNSAKPRNEDNKKVKSARKDSIQRPDSHFSKKRRPSLTQKSFENEAKRSDHPREIAKSTKIGKKAKRSDHPKRVVKSTKMLESKVKRSDHPTGIVKSTKIGCIAKGQRVGRKQLRQMCDICQRSSELDIDRFPRFINELTCETASGSPSHDSNSCTYHSIPIGTCVQSTMTVDLLKRTDTFTVISPPPSGDYFVAYKQVWVPYTQEIRSCCQCRYA